MIWNDIAFQIKDQTAQRAVSSQKCKQNLPTNNNNKAIIGWDWLRIENRAKPKQNQVEKEEERKRIRIKNKEIDRKWIGHESLECDSVDCWLWVKENGMSDTEIFETVDCWLLLIDSERMFLFYTLFLLFSSYSCLPFFHFPVSFRFILFNISKGGSNALGWNFHSEFEWGIERTKIFELKNITRMLHRVSTISTRH